jgi:branched-chain amino acid transport system substrate-binding protein
MSKKIIAAVIIILVLVIGFTIKNKQTSSEEIKIGFVIPLTGDAATYGEPMQKAATLAVDEINKNGGINGKKLTVIYEDSKCKGKEALTAVQKLISIDKVKIIDGFTCAEDLLSVASLLEENKILALAPGASSPQVSKAGDYIFQNNPSASIATKQLAVLMASKYKKVAIISEKTGFATDINNYFVKEFQSAADKIVHEEAYTSDTRDFRDLILKVKAAQPEAIFVNPQTEIAGGTIIKQLRNLGVDVPLYGMDTISGSKTREIAGQAIEGLTILAVPGLNQNNLKAQKFLKDFTQNFGQPTFDLYLGSSYDSINIIAQAIAEVGNNPTKIKDYLYKLKSYSGVIGTYSFDQNGDIVGIDFVVKKIIDGNLVEVK